MNSSIRLMALTLAGITLLPLAACNHNKPEPKTEAEPEIEIIAPETQPEGKVDPFADFMVHPSQIRQLGMNITWQSAAGLREGESIEHITIGEKHFALLTDKNMLTSYAVDSGLPMWNALVREEGEETSKPVIYQDNTYVVGQSRLWRFDGEKGRAKELVMDHTVSTAPLMIDKELGVMSSANGRVYWVDLWFGFAPSDRTYQMRGGIQADPVLIASTVLVSDVTGGVAVFNARSGNPIWRKQLFDRITTQPVANRDIIYISCEDQTLYALGRTSGDIIWKNLFEVPLKHNPCLLDNLVFLYVPEDAHQGTRAFDANSGKERWRLDFDATPILARDKEILFWSPQDKTAYLINKESGRILKKVPMPRVDKITKDPFREGVLYLANNEGKLMKLAPLKKLAIPGTKLPVED